MAWFDNVLDWKPTRIFDTFWHFPVNQMSKYVNIDSVIDEFASKDIVLTDKTLEYQLY